MSAKDFLDKCYFIATKHPNSRRIDFENDICAKTEIKSFKDSFEYRDRYIIISSAIDDDALYVEMIDPFSKVLFFIDGRGKIITFDSDFQYLYQYINQVYSQIL